MRYDAERSQWVCFDQFDPADDEEGGLVPVMHAVGLALETGFLRRNDRDPEASRLAYRDYLDSSHWWEVKTRARLRSGGHCQRCDAIGRRLEVHHLTYARLGRESEGDLIVLCNVCHRAEHGTTVP